jgi:hypothetical protein
MGQVTMDPAYDFEMVCKVQPLGVVGPLTCNRYSNLHGR